MEDERVRRFSNKIERKDLKPGDHIYSYRKLKTYSHHGIYVGENRVIHFTRTPKKHKADRRVVAICRECNYVVKNRPGGVVKTCIDCFLKKGDLYRHRYDCSVARLIFNRGGTCSILPSSPVDVVLFRANCHLQLGFGKYELFKNNCEDFALHCKTGLLKPETSLTLSAQLKLILPVGLVIFALQRLRGDLQEPPSAEEKDLIRQCPHCSAALEQSMSA